MAAPGNHLLLGWPKSGKPIVLTDKDRLEHTIIFGQTGTGKSRYVQGLGRCDIRQSSKTGCGLLLIDPHGEMFDGIMGWIAANRLTNLPIIPIDFRRADQIISYNPLRQRPAA